MNPGRSCKNSSVDEIEPLRFHGQIPTPDHIYIRTATTFNYAGAYKIDEMLQAANFLRDNVETTQHDIIYNSVREFLSIVELNFAPEAAWFTIRLQKPTKEFIVPRWHRDGRMFRERIAGYTICTKIATTLYGPPTRLLEETPLVSQTVKFTNGDNRQNYAEVLANEPHVPNYTGRVFSFTCGEVNSPVHSEPDINTDRIFMSIVPGATMQIKQLAELRNLEYS